MLGYGYHVGKARRVAVDGRRGGEDDVGDGVGLHGPQEAERAVDIGVVVGKRDESGFADSFEGGEVDYRVDVGVLVEDSVEGFFVGHVQVVEERALAAY